MQPGQVAELPSNLAQLSQLATTVLPALVPLFTTIAAQRDMGGQRLTFAHTETLRLADLGPLLDALGLGQRLPGIMQTIGLVLGGRFDLPPHGCLLALGQGADGPEFEIYVLLSALNDLPANFLSLLTLGLAERPRELMALERWMEAFTPEDDVWPGRFSILSTFAYAAALVAFAISQNYVLSFMALVACGITDVFTAVTRMTIMQLSAPAQMRGRIMANMRIITGGIGPLAETQSGLLASLLGGPLAVITAAGALVGAAGWTARTNPAFWQQKSDEPEVTETPGSSTTAVTARDA